VLIEDLRVSCDVIADVGRLFFPSTSLTSFVTAGIGIGTIFGSLISSYARNPSLKQQLFSYAILGFALAEAMGLFCLMMAFIILYA
jgi:F-type H+-transporting ATPase subunit c